MASSTQLLSRSVISTSNSRSKSHATENHTGAAFRYQKSMQRYARACESYAEDAARYNALANAYLMQVQHFNFKLGSLLKVNENASFRLLNLPAIPSMPKLPVVPIPLTKPFEPRQSALSVLRQVSAASAKRNSRSVYGKQSTLGGRLIDKNLILESQKMIEKTNTIIAWSSNEVALANMDLQKSVQAIKDAAAKQRPAVITSSTTNNHNRTGRKRSATVGSIRSIGLASPPPKFNRRHAEQDSDDESDEETISSKRQMKFRPRGSAVTPRT
ncbi:hypothetical protein VTL71DRAFT_14908 [Oculimacula yallundae]|uniref:Uncharacterized protein n=1 Tax=Oculimacula yallundae TaxID=86028 RepID=A0ABR4CGC6_9HELO